MNSINGGVTVTALKDRIAAFLNDYACKSALKMKLRRIINAVISQMRKKMK